ncbi:MAG TPA: hypothetical protein HPP80_07675, partial [Rhodospirillaceae bacterium]|nr:hypothetical protein [Rhodospirillaceae bacterium]
FLAHAGLLEKGLKLRPMVLPDRFIEHNTQDLQYDEAGLNAAQIVAMVINALSSEKTQARA